MTSSGRPAPPAPGVSCRPTAKASTSKAPDPISSSLFHFLLHLPIDYFCTYTDPDLPRSVRETTSETVPHLPRMLPSTSDQPTLLLALETAHFAPDKDIYMVAPSLLSALHD